MKTNRKKQIDNIYKQTNQLEKEYWKRIKSYKKSKYKQPKVISERNLTNLSYKEKYINFLKSPFWKIEREKILKRFNYKCVLCFSTDNLNIHHISYEDLYCRKPASSQNVVLVCRYHHEQFHKLYKVKNNMIKEWEAFVKLNIFKK